MNAETSTASAVTTLQFKATTLHPIVRDGRPWLTAKEVAECIGYANANSVNLLLDRNQDEFDDCDTRIIKMNIQGQDREVRIFSPSGCQLVGFFASTERAKEFRRWAKHELAARQSTHRPHPNPLPHAGEGDRLEALRAENGRLKDELIELLRARLTGGSHQLDFKRREYWAPAQEQRVLEMARGGASDVTIARALHRSLNSVRCRLQKLRRDGALPQEAAHV